VCSFTCIYYDKICDTVFLEFSDIGFCKFSCVFSVYSSLQHLSLPCSCHSLLLSEPKFFFFGGGGLPCSILHDVKFFFLIFDYLCNHEASILRRLWPTVGCCTMGKGGGRNRLKIHYIETCLNTCIRSVHVLFYIEWQSVCIRCV